LGNHHGEHNIMSVTCGTCTVEQETWSLTGEKTPTGKPKKKKILVPVPKEFEGTEEEAEAAGWVLGEFGYQCPSCAQATEAALADVEDDPTPGDNESATIHHALNQLTSQTVSESIRVNREQVGNVGAGAILTKFFASGHNFVIARDSDGSFWASLVDDDVSDASGHGSTSLNALADLACQYFPHIPSQASETEILEASGLHTQWVSVKEDRSILRGVDKE
jgi:hypothetical protein